MSSSATKIQLQPTEDARRLAQLLQRAPQGVGLDPREALPLIRSNDPTVRGLARRLLSGALLHQARLDSAQLLRDACVDLDFRVPEILSEATESAASLGRLDDLYELLVRAAERQSRNQDTLGAITSLANAVSSDLRNGATRLNDPEALRRLIAIYQRCASQAEAVFAIQRAARGVRRSPADGPLRLAHVVCQLVDGGHAPSRSIRTILRNADERFEHYLVVTDALAGHAQQPLQAYVSHPTRQRAPKLLAELSEMLAAPVILPSRLDSAPQAAAELHARLAALNVDIAFFHGSLATPTDWLLCAWQAAPWQVDCGFGVPLHSPAVDHQFFEFETTMEKLAFQCRELGIPYSFCGGGHDASDVEQAQPFSREELGIPPDALLIGTIGNHLQTRMSVECCRTLADVLRRRPNVYLLLVGPGDFAQHKAAFGEDLCNAEGRLETGPTLKTGPTFPRVRFTGPTREAARMTQSFDIVLNTFPGGGGFVIGDAMAAGKPVVCMQASDSCLGSAGAEWVGAENLVKPPTPENYARRLEELIDNPAERAALGARLKARFRSQFDARAWVRSLSDVVWDCVHR